MHGRLLGGGGGAVDPDVVADQARLGVLPRALVRVDEPAGALGADLAVVQVLVVLEALGLGVRVGLLLLLGDALLERLAGGLLVRRVAEALAGRPVLARRVAAVELVLDVLLRVLEGVLGGQLVLVVDA